MGLVVAQGAHAAPISDTEELSRFGSIGEGAGQLKLPWGIAADGTTSHILTAELGANNRVSEFTPWGDFVKALGWDVAPGAVNEQQEVRVRAASGQFKLNFGAESTTDLPFNAKGSEVQAALEGLAAVGPGNVNVVEVRGTITGTTPFIFVIAFKGALAGTDLGQVVASDGTTSLAGGVPTTSLVVRTRVDGHAATAGFETCTAESGCQAGLEGSGAGQFAQAQGVTVDTTGNFYVREVDNHRVQAFDSAGRFLWMAGGEVNKTKSAEGGTSEAERNLCTEVSTDECGVGVAGTGMGQFAATFSGGIALCSGKLYVADKDRIQRFAVNGEFEAALSELGKTVQGVACDPVSGGLYATFEPEPNVHKLDASTGAEVGDVAVPAIGAIVTDPTGNLFAVSGGKVLEFDSAGNPLTPPNCCETAFDLKGLGFSPLGTLYATYATPSVDSFIRAFGPAPVSFESPALIAPEISAQFASSVGREEATVAADINPNFFTDTVYYVEYGTGECETGGCPNKLPLPPGPFLTLQATNSPVRSGSIDLKDLDPATTYHYRFVAKSTGGGPVFGIDPDGNGLEEASEAEGEEASFTTFPDPTPIKACANDALRLGPAAQLPECRAYEMVSPVDKDNGDIRALLDLPGFNTALSQSASNGSRFTFSSYRGFGNPEAAPYASQYLAGRNPVSGWSSEPLSPRQTTHYTSNSFENHYKAFSGDLCKSWLIVAAEPVLAPEASPGFNQLYRRENCGGGYRAMVQVEPNVAKAEEFFPILQGTSSDGSAAVFAVEDKLTAEAAADRWQAYYASGGNLALICVGLNGLASGGNCSVGTGPALKTLPELEHFSSLDHALSANGSKAYWTESGINAPGPGKIFVRLNPGAEQSEIISGECTEPEKACTLKVSDTVVPNPEAARFLGASVDGGRALFEVTAGTGKGKLFKFELETGSSTPIAGKTLGVAAASDDLSRVYFVSEEALAGTSGATGGKPNLYLDEEGAKTFVATLASGDTLSRVASTTASEPVFHAARATADGRVLTFISTASLTGYDNADAVSGKADSEVYRYEAGASGPVCVSCNPSGARPQGRVLSNFQASTGLPTASYLTLPTTALYSPRVLSPDGNRLFFNSFDPLLPRDTNGKGDVYEWISAPSQAACSENGAELYVAKAAGCLSLISTGQSSEDSELLDTGADGNDAFFVTDQSLLPRDPGLVDVYDARVNGGFAEPPPPPTPCQGEACQPMVPPPANDPTPASSTFVGPENEKPKKKKAKKNKRKHKKQSNKKKKGKKANGKRGARR
jgi:hypothetical protein